MTLTRRNTRMRNPILSLSLISGTLGFLIGMGYSTFQVAVEGAQVVSGIVQYPYPTPFFMYQTKVWTLLHQIPAILLRTGLTEISVSILLSGFMGMCSLLALTLAIYAISKNFWAALGAPFLIAYTGTIDFGAVYPVSLWGVGSTYGTFGLSCNFLAITLISLKRYRIGGFLLGLSLAVHPAQGILYISVVGLCFLLNHKEWREAFRITRKFFLAGLLVSAISLAIHWMLTDRVTFVYRIFPQFVHGFVRSWDGHRHPVDPFSEDVLIGLGSALISLVWLFRFRKKIPETAHFLLYAFTVTALLGFIFSGMSWLPPEKLPLTLVCMMPARILNFGILGYAGLLISLLTHEKNRPAVQWLILLSLPALIFFRKPLFNLYVLLMTTVLFVGIKTIHLPRSGAFISSMPFHKYFLRFVNMSVLFVFFVCFFKIAEDSYRRWSARADRFKDWRSDSFYAAVSQRKGLLLMDPYFFTVQLITRRPILLDIGALDGLPYVPEAGPLMNTILREIYGMDLLEPGWKSLNPDTGHSALGNPDWRDRSSEEWRKIGIKYQISDVLAPAEIPLHLPVTTTNGKFTLYRIPESPT